MKNYNLRISSCFNFKAWIQVWYITSIIPCDCKLDTVIIIWLIGGDRAISSETLAARAKTWRTIYLPSQRIPDMVALLFTFLLQVSTLICHPDVAAKNYIFMWNCYWGSWTQAANVFSCKRDIANHRPTGCKYTIEMFLETANICGVFELWTVFRNHFVTKGTELKKSKNYVKLW